MTEAVGSVRFLWPWIRPYRMHLLGHSAVLCAASGLGLVPAVLQGRTLDALTHQRFRDAAVMLGIGVLLGLVLAFASLAQQRILLLLAHRLSESLRRDVVKSIQQARYDHLSRHDVGRFLNRVEGDVDGIVSALTSALPVMTAALTLSWLLVVMPLCSPPLSVVGYAIIPLWMATIVPLAPKISDIGVRMGEARDVFVTNLGDRLSFGGLMRTKMFVQHEHDMKALLEGFRSFVGLRLERQRAERSTSGLQITLMSLAPAAVTLYGVYLVSKGQCSIGTMFAFSALFGRLFGPVGQLSALGATAMTITFNARRVRELLDLQSERTGGNSIQLFGAIEAEDLRFSYPGQPTLFERLCFQIPAGGKCVIEGESGSGKSTLARVLLALQEPQSGVVRFDGANIQNVAVDDLRAQIGYMPQDASLFAATVRENVSYGRRASEAELWAALEVCAIADTVRQLPQGLDTHLTCNGAGISGGQRQRLCLARTMLSRPRILILDEGTSALDRETEERVLCNLIEAYPAMTLIVITHRRSDALRSYPIIRLGVPTGAEWRLDTVA